MAVRVYAFAVFFSLWAVIGWHDWRKQRIASAHLGYGVLALTAGYGLAGALWLVGSGLARGYCLAGGVHILLCVLAAMTLWLTRIWPAGDAKLFMLLGSLFPLMRLPDPFPHERMFLIVLINTFIPACLVIFLRASHYIFDTRLRAARNFLKALGWKRELDFMAAMLRQGALELISWLKAKGAGLDLQTLKRTGAVLLQWLAGMALMSIISFYLKDFFHSPILLSLLCMALFFLWGQITSMLGAALARFLLVAVVAALLTWLPSIQWAPLGVIFGNISIFGLFMFVGVSSMTRALSGQGSFLLMFFLPMAFSAAGFIANRLGRLFAALAGGLLVGLRGGAPIAPMSTFAPLNPYIETVVKLAALGLFFGLSLELVRRWEQEVRPSRVRTDLIPFLVLAPDFIERIREDRDFTEAHFQSFYADGLTAEQAVALKDWCARKGIESVPLASTISFASWIFFGFFLSLALHNAHLMQFIIR